MARPLKQIARYINDNAERLQLSRATVEATSVSTDRHWRGSRLRHPGKGRKGNRIKVWDLKGEIVLDHNAAETYRRNDEVERWLADWERGRRWAFDGWVDRNGVKAKPAFCDCPASDEPYMMMTVQHLPGCPRLEG